MWCAHNIPTRIEEVDKKASRKAKQAIVSFRKKL